MIKIVKSTMISIAALAVVGAGAAQAGVKEAEKMYAEGNLQAALQEYVNVGGNGDVEATFRAARMFETGEGTSEPRFEKAVAWYQVAARAGHLGAMRNLAGMFAEGRGVDQDLVQAWTLLNIGAERGDAESAKARDALSEQMRPGQLAAGERRTEKLAPKYQGS